MLCISKQSCLNRRQVSVFGLLITVAFVRLNGDNLGIRLSNAEPLAYVVGAAIAGFHGRMHGMSAAPQARQLTASPPRQADASLVSNETATRTPILNVSPDAARTATSTSA